MARQHLYADPEIYDILHADGTASDVARFARVARRVSAGLRGVKQLRWLEPASGSGRYLLACAKRGDVAVGIDFSKEMVAYTLARAEAAGLSGVGGVVGRMETFDLGKVEWAGKQGAGKNGAGKPTAFGKAHVVFNPINSIRHVATDSAMLKHLDRVRACLHADGVYIVGLSLSAYGLETVSEDVWVGKRGKTTVTQVVQYEPPDEDARGAAGRRERVMSHLTIERGGVEEHRDSSYWLRTYNLQQWLGLVEKAKWRVAGTFDNTGKIAKGSEPGYYLFVLVPTRGK
jgi:SAM-dependent methyltransferase